MPNHLRAAIDRAYLVGQADLAPAERVQKAKQDRGFEPSTSALISVPQKPLILLHWLTGTALETFGQSS
jgi:hypothetical protein